jgi:putative oxidoreductase
MTLTLVLTVAVRYLLVVLFLPFSALDKILNFNGAVGQAEEQVPVRAVAVALIVAGLCVEILMPLAILTGVADRLAALVLAGYCGVTALLWKQFWRPGDFWRSGPSKGRDLFWDFLKNFSLAGGFLLITFGTGPAGVAGFLAHPLSSSHPYALHAGALNGGRMP